MWGFKEETDRAQGQGQGQGVLHQERGLETLQGKESISAKARNGQWTITFNKADCVPGTRCWTSAPAEFTGTTEQY